ncbi:hypothetical protein AALP_AA8G130300 [Arabis alpina]|uniref:DUF2828 domain-containing protein n=1 Tax=Arabis alpina TaxID=50452 RepID=A0A087G6Q5_ARAAL|nr:hypothetical protein AALP_AA8G130300 [Arabis alpina]
MASPLIGPPEIRDSVPANPITSSGPSDPIMHKSVEVIDHSSPLRGQTENGADTYLSTGNPCLDFFFHVVPGSSKESIEERLVAAWNHDALTTLKLICNLRGVRGTGKSDKEGFYAAALWLHDCHPKTLAGNLEPLSKFGYFKDFPELLYRILQGYEIRKTQKSEWNQRQLEIRKSSQPSRRGRRFRQPSQSSRRSRSFFTRGLESRKDKKIVLGTQALTRYAHDPNYRFLHERVSDLFADQLRRDMEFLNSGETNQISLASKWCPSLDSSFDRATLICESIAKKVFPRKSYPEYEGVEEAHYAYRVRDRLRKQVLVPLRKTLQLPEVYMGARDWESLPYNRVASVAMKTYKKIFYKHDEVRFRQYLEDARSGKTTIAAGALLPHEIIEDLNDGYNGGQVAELQWKRMVDDMREKGSLTNCIAISDLSGSMHDTPMEVAIALGLLISELSEEPWRGKLITFSENPALHLVEGDDLRSKTEFVSYMDWGYKTDFQKVFDLILKVAVDSKLKPEEMIKRVFVFSDMEFDEASGRNGTGPGWETDYEAIVRKYKEKGYGEAVPEIVFWNLRPSASTPVLANQKGVALVSGYSKNLIKMFLDNDGEICPEDIDIEGEENEGEDNEGRIDPMKMMEAAISGEEYEKLVVIADGISNETTSIHIGETSAMDNDGGIDPLKMTEAAISGEEYEKLVVIADGISNEAASDKEQMPT